MSVPMPETVVLNLSITIAGEPAKVQLPAPNRPARPGELLPAFQVLSDAMVSSAVTDARREGLTISCRKGCGACCRQPVTIAPVEARFLSELVRAFPEPRRTDVLARFAETLRRLEEAGMLERLRHLEHIPPKDRHRFALEYFGLGLPCPFLEDESCSIHPERPLVCREYLVTSPAENCAHPTPESIRRVPVIELSETLNRFGDASPHPGKTWVPLVLALEWADTHPDTAPERPGPEWLLELVRAVTGREIPPPRARD